MKKRLFTLLLALCLLVTLLPTGRWPMWAAYGRPAARRDTAMSPD